MMDIDAAKDALESLQSSYFKLLDLADRLRLLDPANGEPLEKYYFHRVIVAIRQTRLACISMGAYVRTYMEVIRENLGVTYTNDKDITPTERKIPGVAPVPGDYPPGPSIGDYPPGPSVTCRLNDTCR
jgi:hypothetical protein